MLTVNESMELNTVLCYLLCVERDACPLPEPAEARDAALRLVAKAHRVLGAGLMPHQVHDAWPMPGRRKKGAPR